MTFFFKVVIILASLSLNSYVPMKVVPFIALLVLSLLFTFIMSNGLHTIKQKNKYGNNSTACTKTKANQYVLCGYEGGCVQNVM